MTPLKQKLQFLAKLKYFSLLNIHNYSASTELGSLRQPRIDIRNWLKDELIYEIHSLTHSAGNEKARNTFYALTEKGFSEAGFKDSGKKFTKIKRLRRDRDNIIHRTFKSLFEN